MKKSRIIDADKLIGKLDMNYDWALAEFEASRGERWVSSLGDLPSPSEIERRAERYLAQGLAAVAPAVQKGY
jgi:hypothetical protein